MSFTKTGRALPCEVTGRDHQRCGPVPNAGNAAAGRIRCAGWRRAWPALQPAGAAHVGRAVPAQLTTPVAATGPHGGKPLAKSLRNAPVGSLAAKREVIFRSALSGLRAGLSQVPRGTGVAPHFLSLAPQVFLCRSRKSPCPGHGISLDTNDAYRSQWTVERGGGFVSRRRKPPALSRLNRVLEISVQKEGDTVGKLQSTRAQPALACPAHGPIIVLVRIAAVSRTVWLTGKNKPTVCPKEAP